MANGEPELFDSQATFNQLQRNCLFGEADVLYDLGRWEEASDAYRNLAGRFMNKPESLEALVRLAECHRKLGKPEEAKKAIHQAEQILSRIPPELDEQFVSLTRADRAGWQKTLGWLKKWD
jgi:tetratricopeptide (TPR) repeat protein